MLGLWDSAYLWWVYASPSRPLLCLGTGCDAVRASSYANLWGLPLPVYGVAMYAALVLLIFAQPLVSPSLARGIRYAVAGVSSAGFLVSLYLTGIEAFVLHAWCAWCVVSALAVTGILALAILELIRPAAYPEPAAALAAVRMDCLVFLIALGAGTPAFFFLMRAEALAPVQTPAAQTLLERLVRPDSHIAGDPQAAVTVVEFGDFQCATCGAAEKAAREIRRKYGNRIRFVFRHFPLGKVHPQAEKAAQASECAAEQGKFWEAVEKFYEGQSDLSEAALERYARELGLDSGRFRACLASGSKAGRIRRDGEDARALSVRGTPTFFVGQRMIEGPVEFDQFARLVEQELASRQATVANSDMPPAGPPRGKALEAHPQSGEAKPTADSSLTTPGLLATSGGIFTQYQASATACREDEAPQQQPALIRTPEARQLFETGSKTLFVDVRPARDFGSGRIPGALNVPVEEIERRWGRLPKDRSIVLYESGRSPGDVCASSRAAARVLLAHGFAPDKVSVYQDGLAGWEKGGLPLER